MKKLMCWLFGHKLPSEYLVYRIYRCKRYDNWVFEHWRVVR